MSDGSISQDEIDALLSGMDVGGTAAVGNAPAKPTVSEFKQKAFDIFLANPVKVFEQNLSSMTDNTTKVNSISFAAVDREAFMQTVPEVAVVTTCDFAAGIDGEHIFVMPTEMVSKIVALVNHEDKVEIDDMALSVVSEIIGQYLGAQIKECDAHGLKGLAHNPPESMSIPKAMIRLPQKEFFTISYDTSVDGGTYTFWEVLSDPPATKIAEAVNGGAEPKPEPTAPAAAQTPVTPQAQRGMPQPAAQNNAAFTGGISMDNFAPMNTGNMMQVGMNPDVQPVSFPPLQNINAAENKGNIGLIMDVYMELTVELGRTKKTVKEILGMGEGHIISLDKLAGESVDILVNHKPIAKGEVVVIEENFGVRVTEILSPSERATNLTS